MLLISSVCLRRSWLPAVYHVIVHCRDLRTVINSDFWPSGVGCRKFHKIRQGGPQHVQQCS